MIADDVDEFISKRLPLGVLVVYNRPIHNALGTSRKQLAMIVGTWHYDDQGKECRRFHDDPRSSRIGTGYLLLPTGDATGFLRSFYGDVATGRLSTVD